MISLQYFDNISHSAHIGGLIGGYLMIRFYLRSKMEFKWQDVLYILKANPRLNKSPVTGPGPRPAKKKRKQNFDYTPPDLSLVKEEDDEKEKTRDPMLDIDPILDKIGKHGLKSLTKEERKVLEKAKDKLN